MKRGENRRVGVRVRACRARAASFVTAALLVTLVPAFAACGGGAPPVGEADARAAPPENAASQAAAAAARAEEDAILSAVQDLFDAMAERDTAAVARALHPEGHLLAVAVGEGAPPPRGMSRAQFVELLGQPGPPVIERMWDARVLVHDPIAVVWTPYDLWIGEDFSHCGVDALTMVRTDEGWKVAGGIYTLEREGCPESPFGPPELP